MLRPAELVGEGVLMTQESAVPLFLHMWAKDSSILHDIFYFSFWDLREWMWLPDCENKGARGSRQSCCHRLREGVGGLWSPAAMVLNQHVLSTLTLWVTQSCLTLCSPVDCSPPGSSVHGILQARILEWFAKPSSRGSSWPRDQTHVCYVSCIAGKFFTTSTTWEDQHATTSREAKLINRSFKKSTR